ncbi:hypothetical protein EAI_04506 [Harpegnathos saltator]|uniref:DUF4806 domain-containing protein n=1 Tax=Harpegnathos saltator TaxID=610380 RepID=E2C1Y7_HARSA|nr:hypothetical protein EAI_04506 [Harpegnathos saltator]
MDHAQRKLPMQKETTNTSKVEERLSRIEERQRNVEVMIKKIEEKQQKILKCVQERHSVPRKPHGLPITTLQEIDAFENQDEQYYSEALQNVIQAVGNQQQRGHQEQTMDHAQRKLPMQKETTNTSKVEERLSRIEERQRNVEVMIKKIEEKQQKILKCVQERHSVPRKPHGLPITTLQEIDAFENQDEQYYSEAVTYFHYVGGFNLKEATQLCLKEAVSDALTTFFTWFGREEGRRALCNTRLARVIYDAICRNRHFDKLMRSEFQKQMREALRIAKERYRQRMRGPRPIVTRNRADENFWNNEEEEENMEEPGT